MCKSKYRCAADVNERPAYRDVSGSGLRLFFMPRMRRWMLAAVQQPDGGIQNVIARSLPDDGSSWASTWPWEVEAHGWEVPTATTHGLLDGDAQWVVERNIQVRLSSPGVMVVRCQDEVPGSLPGFYAPQGVANGRVFYVQQLKDASLQGDSGPKCLWFAEDRGQWVLTTPDRLGDSRSVLARIASRAWWPWEAHLGGATSPLALGAMPFASLPAWHRGATLLSSSHADWEVADASGCFRPAAGMSVEVDPDARCAGIKAAEGSDHAFLGVYVRAGVLSARPFFLKTVEDKGTRARSWRPPAAPRFALWYSEEAGQWLVTEDFRLLDALSADARVSDSAWFPWDAAACWEVADSQGGFVPDDHLRIEQV